MFYLTLWHSISWNHTRQIWRSGKLQTELSKNRFAIIVLIKENGKGTSQKWRMEKVDEKTQEDKTLCTGQI